MSAGTNRPYGEPLKMIISASIRPSRPLVQSAVLGGPRVRRRRARQAGARRQKPAPLGRRQTRTPSPPGQGGILSRCEPHRSRLGEYGRPGKGASRNGCPNRHRESCADPSGEQALRHCKHEHQDGARARTRAGCDHRSRGGSPRERPVEFRRIGRVRVSAFVRRLSHGVRRPGAIGGRRRLNAG